MSDGTVGVKQATSPDRLIDNEELEIGGQIVYRQRVRDPESIALLTAMGVVLNALQPLTDTELRASAVEIADATARDLTHAVATVTNGGDTTIHTPSAGKRLRLHWVYAVNDPDQEATPLVRVFLGDTATPANERYRAYALSKRQVVTGPVDGALIVKLDEPGSVAVTALLEEVD